VIETTALDGATLVRLNRPPVNALDIELNEAIASTFSGLAGPVVLTGTDRCFSAGVDLRAILDGGPGYTGRFFESLVAGFLAVFDYPAPVVAAVNGHALAGGCVIAMAADARYMSGGTIGLTEIAVGVPFPVSAIEICRHVMGASATAAALGGEPATPQEALRLAWIDATVEPSELLEVAAARARGLGALSPDAYAFTKQQLHRPARTVITNGAGEDAQALEGWRSDETRARIAAFVAKLAH
jgi:enoyl-CoA hydratase/carnithine racemase